ncbi:MAG: hypothetical protein ABJD53_12460 [Gammaproteobacteria bacterium]
MSGAGREALEHALELSHRLLAAADQLKLDEVAILDAERLRLLQSVRLERDPLSDDDQRMLRQVSELNDRAIGLVQHQRRIKERELDLAAIGRRAVSAYSTTR